MHKKYIVFLSTFDRPDKKLCKKEDYHQQRGGKEMRGADGAILTPISDLLIKDCSCNLLTRTFIHIINR